MIAASGFLSLFFLFLFCIIGHMLADFEKERNFFVVTSLQSQHFTGFITTPRRPCLFIFSDSAAKLKHIFSIQGKVEGGGGEGLPAPNFL